MQEHGEATGERGDAGIGPAVTCGISAGNRDDTLNIIIDFNVIINTTLEVRHQEGQIVMVKLNSGTAKTLHIVLSHIRLTKQILILF
jgi:hypothetical protein